MILIADHNKTNVYILSTVLTHNKYRVVTATGGMQAMQQFRKHKDEITLLIIDTQMPDMNGRAIYEQISAIKPHLPIIFTNTEQTDIVTQQYLSQINGIMLLRPFTIKRLLAYVKTLAPHESRQHPGKENMDTKDHKRQRAHH